MGHFTFESQTDAIAVGRPRLFLVTSGASQCLLSDLSFQSRSCLLAPRGITISAKKLSLTKSCDGRGAVFSSALLFVETAYSYIQFQLGGQAYHTLYLGWNV